MFPLKPGQAFDRHLRASYLGARRETRKSREGRENTLEWRCRVQTGIRRNAPGASCQSLTHRYKTGYCLYWNGFRFWRSRPGLRNGQPRRGRGRSASRARGKCSRCWAKRARANLPKGFQGDGGVRRLDDRGNQERGRAPRKQSRTGFRHRSSTDVDGKVKEDSAKKGREALRTLVKGVTAKKLPGYGGAWLVCSRSMRSSRYLT